MTIQSIIEEKLKEALEISYLDVTNESHMHSVPPGSETHFKAVIVTDDFKGKKQVVRHQIVYAVLAKEIAGPVHALALHTYTSDEWAEALKNAPDSPACMGGSKGDRRAS